MTNKFETADLITIDTAQHLYEIGIVLVVTDGIYVQMEKEV